MPFPQNTPNIDDLINLPAGEIAQLDRKSTRLNSSHQ